MLKWSFLLITSIIWFTSCETSGRGESTNIIVLPGLKSFNLRNLSPPTYESLTRVYDIHSLESRDVTFRDERLLESKGINTVFSNFHPYKTKEEWEKRKEYLRKHILVCAGLWPLPNKTPLNPKYYHRVYHNNYIVETVSIETYPNFFLVGNIYRPIGNGPFPGVLTPHGHFTYGRLNNDSINSIPGRCINLARQGYVVFAYDMVGYNDTRQVSHSFASDSISQLYGINLLGLQLWNSIRALDFLRTLKEVDEARIGITGASGGATQTYLLTGVDNRFNCAAPVNMVSNVMQGGDLCENAPGLRINTFNVEIASMIAPKPLLLVSDTYDWTFNTRNTIMPMVKSIYKLYHSEDNLTNAHFDYIHNYNKSSRESVYAFLGKRLLKQNDKSKFTEKPFLADSDSNLLAFINKRDSNKTKTFIDLSTSLYHNLPNKLGPEALKQELKNSYSKQLNEYWPKDKTTLGIFKSKYGDALLHLIGAIASSEVECKIMGSTKSNEFIATRLLITSKDKNHWIPCIFYQSLFPTNSTVIVTADSGKKYWVQQGLSRPKELIIKLLHQKCNVLAPDLFKQGEHILQNSTKTNRNENDKYFTTYNLTDRQEQVEDLLTLIRAIEKSEGVSHYINLYATGNTGMTGLFLSTITKKLHRIILDGNHFDPSSDEKMLELQIPGIMRIGGLQTVLALASNQHLIFFNAFPSLRFSRITAVSKLENNEDHFSITTEDLAIGRILDFFQ